MVTPTDTYHHTLDHLGSVRQVTDSLGAVSKSHNFYPYGEEATVPASGDSDLKFTGHETG